jgi:hypothetical protein
MKRKIKYTNIEITLPTKKKYKIDRITIKLSKEMSSTDTEELYDYIKTRRDKYPNNQQKRDNYDHLSSESEFEEVSEYDSDNETIIEDEPQEESIEQNIEELENDGADIINDNMTVISEVLESTISDQSIIRTPQPEDKYDQIAKQLSSMDRYLKGEAMEEKIKDQLEEYGFIVTKTQSSIGKRIIGDNGIDHLAQITINNRPIRMIIQSKNWNSELTARVVRDLQGVLTTQYPDRIGIIVVNNGGINIRAKNQAKGSLNTVLIYNFNELKYLRNDLKNLYKKNKIRIQKHQIEKFKNAKIIEEINGPIRKTTIKAKKYYRYTAY